MAYRVRWIAACLTLLIGTAAGAQAPSPPPKAVTPSKPPVAPDPAFDAARAAYEALPEAERKGLQDALVWTGDYNSVVTGTYGRRTHDALLAYAARTGARDPAFPGPATRAALLASGEAARKAAAFSLRRDGASGVTLGVPERLLPKRSSVPGGTRWQSADGAITLDTKSFPPGETDLDAIFARITAPATDRKVTYKIKRPDFLVVTAETTQGKSYIRYAAGAEGIRGFTIGYGKAASAEVDRLVIAVANSFTPFDSAAPAAVPERGPAPAVALPPVAVVRRAPAATGLVVEPARVLTSARALDGCATPSIGGKPARVVAGDPARGLALLDWTPPGKGSAGPSASLRVAPAAEAETVMVLGAEAAGAVAVAPGEATGESVYAPLQPGAGGAPILDRSGALLGLVASFPASPRLVAGVMPPTRYTLLPGVRIAAFLAENGVVPGPGAVNPGPNSIGAVTSRLGGLVVGIECNR
ncbi:serine protease [uncultured Methylobacterium sp.]|uniref:serine protease n=1 Tax=uncultured Methylobacterium sp. TaxID=157278 RepID=UPI0035CC67B1